MQDNISAGGTLTRYVRFAKTTLEAGTIKPTIRSIGHRVRSSTPSYGLKRDLTAPHETPVAKIPITVRPMIDADVEPILDLHAEVDLTERWERQTRGRLLDSGIGRPYVAVNEDDEPCYVQWLFSSEDNDKVRSFFHGIFPVLGPNEALLEGAFTPVKHQGQRIMSAGMSMIAEKATDLGARYVVTFVGTDNIASLKGCERAGFLPYINRVEKRLMGRRFVEFQEMSSAEVEQARVLKPSGA
ncbi:GNAT family N-acetyltransferase [Actinomycetospora flava]|uniref:GNAT family protein n=1 Tax=Actinomycetospora flava TaxID=3129232 RepID=A0ABU8M4W7_9PSEU